MKRKKKENKSFIFTVLFMVIAATCYSYYMNSMEVNATTKNEVLTQTSYVQIENSDELNIDNDKLNIVFFYVGQADCTFIKLNDMTMLIDAGNNLDGAKIIECLKNHNITQIDYVVGTHSDEDHIGGIDKIIKEFDIDNIFMSAEGTETVNYKMAKRRADEKKYEIKNVKAGDSFEFGEANFKIVSAKTGYDVSDNNSSIVIQLDYKNTKYLFMGDAEKQIEKECEWEDVDVLKVGHHGSASSSTIGFLEKVKPEYAYIEVGKNNHYNLPKESTITNLNKVGAKIFRTDTNCSSFLVTSDGYEITSQEVAINLDGNE